MTDTLAILTDFPTASDAWYAAYHHRTIAEQAHPCPICGNTEMHGVFGTCDEDSAMATVLASVARDNEPGEITVEPLDGSTDTTGPTYAVTLNEDGSGTYTLRIDGLRHGKLGVLTVPDYTETYQSIADLIVKDGWSPILVIPAQGFAGHGYSGENAAELASAASVGTIPYLDETLYWAPQEVTDAEHPHAPGSRERIQNDVSKLDFYELFEPAECLESVSQIEHRLGGLTEAGKPFIVRCVEVDLDPNEDEEYDQEVGETQVVGWALVAQVIAE